MEAYGEHALTEWTFHNWFVQFKNGYFGLKYEERPGRPTNFEDKELDEDCCKTHQELA